MGMQSPALKVLQDLVQTCATSSRHELSAIVQAFSRITYQDLAVLLPAARRLHPCRAGKIETCTLYRTDPFTLVAFFVPNGLALPLHDHPNMSVVTRVLYGCIRVTAFDWCAAPDANPLDGTHPKQHKMARCVRNSIIGASENLVHHFDEVKQGGTLHRIEGASEEGGVFLDYISPSYYSAPNFPPCTYYDTFTLPPSTHTSVHESPVDSISLETCKPLNSSECRVGDEVLMIPLNDYPAGLVMQEIPLVR